MKDLIAVALSALVGVALGMGVAWAAADPGNADTGCADALAGVVEAIETTWSTASEAVDRAQSAVRENPDVRNCLAER